MSLMYGVNIILLALVIHLYYPVPPLSPRVQEWKDKGKFFNYKEFKIFNIDKLGEGKKEDVLICLHGFPTSSYDWIKIHDKLLQLFGRVIFLDFLGYGFSDKPRHHKYTIFEQADIVESLLKSNGLTNYHILSHDVGNTIGLELLARQNKTDAIKIESFTMMNGGKYIKKFIYCCEGTITPLTPDMWMYIWDPPYLNSSKRTPKSIFPETNNPRPIQKVLLIPFLGSFISKVGFYKLFRLTFGEVFGTNKPTEEDYVDFWSIMEQQHGTGISHKLLQFIPERTLYKDRWVGALAKTSIPVLFIYGPADPINTKPFIEHYRKVVPQHGLKVLDDHIGHYPQWEDPEHVIEAFGNFRKQESQPNGNSTESIQIQPGTND